MIETAAKLPQRVHIIGICGVATSALTIAFKEKGVEVTGSDKGFFPPVSSELEKHGISFYAGWHPEKMFKNGVPDIVIVGTASGSHNPETAAAKEKNIPMYSFAEAIGKYFSREKSIVCVGTWGKTSSAALLSFILDYAGLNPAYMFGGVSLSHRASARLADSSWSVLEGDEYKSSPTDPRAKFFHYRPTHLLLTAISWDHADLYATEKSYFDAFRELLSTIPEKGFIAACADNEGTVNILKSFNGRIIYYGRKRPLKNPIDYAYSNVSQTKGGLDLVISHSGKDYKIHSPMLGLFQAENIAGCFAIASELGVAPSKIIEAISMFKGLKRRLEKRFDGAVTVIDDIAHSPEKALSVLYTLKSIYEGKIMAVFEPNIGGRSRGSIAKYDNAFRNADTVMIPHLTKLKSSENASEQPMEGEELATVISKTHQDARYMDDDEKLVDFLASNTKTGDVIAFLGSHGFRGMIEETIAKLK